MTVVDRDTDDAASWGNAGYLTPGFAVPLPEPAALRAGLKVLSPASPVQVSGIPDTNLLRFATRFLPRCSHRRWDHALRAISPINRIALQAHEELDATGTAAAVVHRDPILVGFRDSADLKAKLTELRHVVASGMPVRSDVLTASETRSLEPTLSAEVSCGMLLHDQRSIDPPMFLRLLRKTVLDEGGRILAGQDVVALNVSGRGVAARSADGAVTQADIAVLACGAWLSPLARQFGVRQPVQAGRGYSFRMPPEANMPTRPTYLPTQRVVCTPLADGATRVSGIMEFARPNHPQNPDRFTTIAAAADPMLSTVDWTLRTEEWCGSRPCTADGLPLVGASHSERVFVHGGHGMWGMTQGPATAKLLARQIATGNPPSELAALNPLR
ncbi:D-amino-acid dehydrogenase [Prauserella sediminis]|uniref:D-amino-acid dehydrogenase n=1 Tax=Prauserella sediminis TaxID=577680 RepID=A0A839XVH2_9PSEU|nr:D-amino-acid dehydrogenase [Prauserella sediminis]